MDRSQHSDAVAQADRDRWPALHELVNSQKFVTRDDVRGLQVPDSSFIEHARGLGWDPKFKGLWVPPGLELDHRTMAKALQEVLGKGSIFTGATALFFDGIIDEPPDQLEVVVPLHDTPAARQGVCFHRTSTFDKIRYHRLGDLRVAATPRALADDAAHSDFDNVCLRLAASHRLRKCTVRQAKGELDRRGRFPGRTRFRTAIEVMLDETAHSKPERLGRRLIRAEGHRPLPKPHTVTVGDILLAEIDIAFLEIMYGVEIDGPHHLLPEVQSADRARDRKLERIHWEIDRFWWYEVEKRQDWFVQEVNRRITDLTEARRLS